MKRTTRLLEFAVPAVLGLALAACGDSNSTPDAGFIPRGNADATVNPDATAAVTDTGLPPADSGPAVDSGPQPDSGIRPDSGVATSVITVHEAFTNTAAYRTKAVEIHGAIVIAENHYTATGGTPVQTLWVQDPTGGPGISVYHSANDTTAVVNVGDQVTINGHLSVFDGQIQISTQKASATKPSIPLAVAATGMGTSTGGAYPPAGTFTQTSSMAIASYSHSMIDNHPMQVGNALQFTGALTITSTKAFFSTGKPPQGGGDGGVTIKGFEVNGALWVNDTLVYKDCIKTLDGGIGSLNLSKGIRGVWDKYQDYYGSTPNGSGPVVQVLYPTTCADLSPP